MNFNNYHRQLIEIEQSLATLGKDNGAKLMYLEGLLTQALDDRIKVRTLLITADIYELEAQSEKLDKTYAKLLPLARVHLSGEDLLTVLVKVADHTLFHLQDTLKALKLFHEVISIANREAELSQSLSLALAYDHVGVLIHDRGKAFLGIRYLNKALEIYTDRNDIMGLSRVLNNIGLVYKREKRFEQAISYFTDAIKYLSQNKSQDQKYYRNFINFTCNLAYCLIESGDIEAGKIQIENAVNIKNKITTVNSGYLTYCKGILEKKHKNYSAAIEYFQQHLDLKVDSEFNFLSNVRMGEIYYEQGILEKAIDYFSSAVNAVNAKDALFELDSVYEKMSMIYETLGDKDTCIVMLRKKEVVKQQQLEEAQSYNIMMLEYEFDTKLNRLELNHKSELLEKELQVNLKLKQANKELSTFAHRVAHDLKEPLRMLSSYSKLLEKYIKDDSEIVKEFLTYIMQSSKRMNDMVNALLDFAVLETHLKEPTPVSFMDILLLAKSNLHYQFQHEKTEMKIDALPEINGHVTLLLILFQNLISNAIKFKRETPVKIHIYQREHEDYYVVCVEDNGIGISPSDKSRIFEMFSRVHSRLVYEGLGIGLATCKKIMEIHNGEIDVESEEGKGSTFILLFPK